MAYGTCLLNKLALKGVTRVQIPFLPPIYKDNKMIDEGVCIDCENHDVRFWECTNDCTSHCKKHDDDYFHKVNDNKIICSDFEEEKY